MCFCHSTEATFDKSTFVNICELLLCNSNQQLRVDIYFQGNVMDYYYDTDSGNLYIYICIYI